MGDCVDCSKEEEGEERKEEEEEESCCQTRLHAVLISSEKFGNETA